MTASGDAPGGRMHAGASMLRIAGEIFRHTADAELREQAARDIRDIAEHHRFKAADVAEICRIELATARELLG